MSLQAFNKTSRKDGRSDSQVIFDLALDMKPNDILTFEVLLAELQKDVDVIQIDRNRTYGAVKRANKRLLKKQNRYLSVIRGMGYKLLQADEHLGVALQKKQTAQKYMQVGLDILEHTIFDELSPNQRILHEQQLLLMKSLYQKVRFHDEKLSETENLLDKMRAEQKMMQTRLEKLENQ
jgi:hypothetical protein